MVLNIKVDDKYVCHIGLLAKLLMIDHVMVSQSLASTLVKKYVVESNEYKDYYSNMNRLIKKSISKDIKLADSLSDIFLHHVKTTRKKAEDGIDVVIKNTTSFEETEKKFYEALDSITMEKKPRFSNYLGDRKETRSILSYTFAITFKRNPLVEELNFHVNNNIRMNISLLTWLCILYTCDESQKKGLSLFPTVSIEESVPEKRGTKTAVLLCGYVRCFSRVSQSHLNHLTKHSENVDFFIHTWNELGKKAKNGVDYGRIWLDNKSGNTNIDELINFYKPKKHLMEDNYSLLSQFSLVGKIEPIFLYYGQAKDDASRYINSQLYSIHRCCQLMEEYEAEMGFKYDNVVKLRFDVLLEKFDFQRICEDCNLDIIYFPSPSASKHGHPYGGGGCTLCDKERLQKSHDVHTNDFCDLWFYGKRDLAVKACQIYTAAEDILRRYHNQNMKLIESCLRDVKMPFIYLHKSEDIEKKIVCFYPERILREHLVNEICCSSDNICGEIK